MLLLGAFALALLGLGIDFLFSAKNSSDAHQVWLNGEPTQGVLVGTKSTSLLGAMTDYRVEVRYVDSAGHPHSEHESFSILFEGLTDDAPMTLRVSRSNPAAFSTSGREAQWLRSVISDGVVALFLFVLVGGLAWALARSTSRKLARLARMRSGTWVALPSSLSGGSPDFAWVSQQADLILGIEFGSEDGKPERWVIGAHGKPFVLDPEGLEQAVASASRASSKV